VNHMIKQIADPGLADEGEAAYRWAYNNMPTLSKTIEKSISRKPLTGRKIGVCLHVTKETSVLIMGLKSWGADVYLCAANPLSTQDHIAAYLESQGVKVFAWRGETPEEYNECILNILKVGPSILMDDGSDAHVAAHDNSQHSATIIGGTEETTTGVIRIRALEEAGNIKYPVIAVNNALTKFLFDNRYGTGQSTFDGILRATSLLIAGKRVVVCGYGWVGKGIAQRARGLGALVTVTEVDPFKGLEARFDGFEAMPIADAASRGDIFITATGMKGVIRKEHISAMKSGAILANAGHFDVEIDVTALENIMVRKSTVRSNLELYELPNKNLYLVGSGRIANLVAAEGHPPEVMSLSFSNQILSALYVAENEGKLEKRVHDVPKEIDQQVAVTALEAQGIRIDSPTQAQLDYAKSWQL